MIPSSGEREELAKVLVAAHRPVNVWTDISYFEQRMHLAIADAILSAGYRRAAGWRPISEAPRDGTWLQVYWPTMRMPFFPAVVFWDEGAWEFANDYMKDYGEVFPTHFQPLPLPPEEEKP